MALLYSRPRPRRAGLNRPGPDPRFVPGAAGSGLSAPKRPERCMAQFIQLVSSVRLSAQVQRRRVICPRKTPSKKIIIQRRRGSWGPFLTGGLLIPPAIWPVLAVRRAAHGALGGAAGGLGPPRQPVTGVSAAFPGSAAAAGGVRGAAPWGDVGGGCPPLGQDMRVFAGDVADSPGENGNPGFSLRATGPPRRF